MAVNWISADPDARARYISKCDRHGWTILSIARVESRSPIIPIREAVSQLVRSPCPPGLTILQAAQLAATSAPAFGAVTLWQCDTHSQCYHPHQGSKCAAEA